MGGVAELRLRRDVAGLVQMLEGGSSMEKMAAAETLGDLNSQEAATALIACLGRGREEPYCQYAAAEALGKLKDRVAVGPLIDVVLRHEYGNAVAAQALGRLGDPSAIEPILSSLVGDGPADRGAMACALADLDAREALLRVAEDDVDGGMLSRWPAAMALVALDDARVVDVLTALPIQLPWTEKEISQALARLGDTRALARLSWNLRSDDFELRRASVEALGELGLHASLPVILQALGDENPLVQAAAARAAARVPRAYGPLIFELWSEDPLVRAGACDALRILGDPRALQKLGNLLQREEEPFVRKAAAAALVAMPEGPLRRRIVKRLAQELLGAEDEERRLQAVAELGALAAAKEVKVLSRGLNDQRPRVRLAVVDALARLPDPAADVPLTAALGDESASVRARAARALGERPETNSVPALIRALTDSSEDVAARAAESLGRLEAASATPALADARASGGGILRRAVAGALVRILAADDPGSLRPLLDDQDEETQALAASALDSQASDCVARLAEIALVPNFAAATEAIRALGRIGTSASLEVLDTVLRSRDMKALIAIESLRAIGSPEAIKALALSFEQNTFVDNASIHFAARKALVALGT
jgi:HEAT repeat protein